jgi:hypothetical protein
MLAGYVIAHTCQKPQKFALAMNERDEGSLKDNIDALISEMFTPAFYFLRKVMEIAVDYEHAEQLLRKETFIAPVFAILMGNNKD